MQGQQQNGELPVFTNFCFDNTHQIITDHRQPAALWLIMHVITTFIELSNPLPHHSITHGIFTIYFTGDDEYQLVSRLAFKTTDNRTYFTVSRVLDHLEHFKCTKQHYLLFSYWRLWLANK
jgi:hypothetical protein